MVRYQVRLLLFPFEVLQSNTRCSEELSQLPKPSGSWLESCLSFFLRHLTTSVTRSPSLLEGVILGSWGRGTVDQVSLPVLGVRLRHQDELVGWGCKSEGGPQFALLVKGGKNQPSENWGASWKQWAWHYSLTLGGVLWLQ